MKKKCVWGVLVVVVMSMLTFLVTPGFAESVEVRGLVQVTEDGVYLNTEDAEYLLEGMEIGDLDGREVMVSGEIRSEDGTMIMNVYDAEPVVSEEGSEEEPEAEGGTDMK